MNYKGGHIFGDSFSGLGQHYTALDSMLGDENCIVG